MLESLDNLLKNKDYPPILLLFGDEEFLLDEALHKLIKTVVQSGVDDYDFETFDGDESGSAKVLERIVDSCVQFPFISEKRVVVVKNFNSLFSASAKKYDEKSAFARYLANPQKTTFLVLTADVDSLNGLSLAMKDSKTASKAQKIISSAKYPYNIIIDKYSWIEYPKVYDNTYPAWVKKRFAHYGKEISEEACQLLVTQSAQSLRELYNQIEKISIYAKDVDRIEVKTVTEVAGFSRVYNVFELQKTVGRRNLPDSLNIVERMLRAESQEVLIITMLTRYFITLFKLIEVSQSTSDKFQIAGKAGLNPYFVTEYLEALRHYAPQEIERAFGFLAETDEQLKSSSVDGTLLLQKMLINIMEKRLTD